MAPKYTKYRNQSMFSFHNKYIYAQIQDNVTTYDVTRIVAIQWRWQEILHFHSSLKVLICEKKLFYLFILKFKMMKMMTNWIAQRHLHKMHFENTLSDFKAFFSCIFKQKLKQNVRNFTINLIEQKQRENDLSEIYFSASLNFI